MPSSILDRATTLTDALLLLEDAEPNFECLTIIDRIHGTTRLTLSELVFRSRQVQGQLEATGFTKGDVAMLCLPTSPELVSAYFGVLLAGGIPGLLAGPSNRLADVDAYSQHVSRILANAGARVLYAEPAVAELFEATPDLLGSSVLLQPADAGEVGDLPEPRPLTGTDIATIQYSSGSTGTPKGVLLSHQAMLNNIRAIRDGLGLTSDEVSVNWIPLYHDMGLIDAFLLPVLTATRTVLIPTMDFLREPVRWLQAIDDHRGTLSFAPNFAYTLCVNRVPDAALYGLDLSSWRLAVNAAESVLPHTIETFTERFQPYGFAPEAMSPSWGMAETVTFATMDSAESRPRIEYLDRAALSLEDRAVPTDLGGQPSVGIGSCLPDCELQIRSDEGEVLPDRRAGRIWVRSSYMLDGYHCDPDRTGEVLVDGWLDTGDRGYVADGNLYFLSRDKDLIVIAGAKYWPHDVETAVNSVDGVRQGCAVTFGVMDEELGTEVLAVVAETRVSDEERRSRIAADIRTAVRRENGLLVRKLLLVPPGGVQKTTSGKLARSATRELYADQLGVLV